MRFAPLLAALALGAVCTAGHAGPVDYTFNGANNLNLGPTESFGAAPHAITVSAHVSVAGGAWGTADVARSGDALGVNSAGSNPGQIDSNSNRIEGLLFDFGLLDFRSLLVTLSLYNVGGSNPDNLSVWIGDSLDLGSATAPLETTIFSNSNPNNPFAISNFNARYLFIASADDGLNTNSCGGNVNCFRVDNIQAVPEPGSIALAGLALLGLAAARRRA
jgi:hypothetical protein